MSGCASCLLHAPTRLGRSSPHGFCAWYVKKLSPPRAIPAAVAAVGCPNIQPKTAAAEGPAA